MPIVHLIHLNDSDGKHARASMGSVADGHPAPPIALPENHSLISITDVKDFMDLDIETVQAVHNALGLSGPESITLAHQLLATETGLLTLHHMFRDQIVEARRDADSAREKEIRRAYVYFARKYPLPHIL